MWERDKNNDKEYGGLSMYISCKERGVTGVERTIRKHASILGVEGNIFRLLWWGVVHVPKNIGVRPIKWLLLEETYVYCSTFTILA